jgi:hypothetical protein
MVLLRLPTKGTEYYRALAFSSPLEEKKSHPKHNEDKRIWKGKENT